MIYSVWRMASKKMVCTQCGCDQLVPINSARGQEIVMMVQSKQSAQKEPNQYPHE